MGLPIHRAPGEDRGTDVVAETLFVQLEIRLPGFRSILIASADQQTQTLGLSTALTRVMIRAGGTARLVTIAPASRHTARSNDAASKPLDREDIAIEQWTLESSGSTEAARARLVSFAGRTVVCSASLSSEPLALLAASQADGVVVAVRVGKTGRADVERVRAMLDDVGATIIGAVTLS